MSFLSCFLATLPGFIVLWLVINRNHLSIMSQLSEFADRVAAYQATQDIAVEGLTADVAELTRLVADLRASQGEPSAEDKVLLDSIEAKAKTIADKLTALDAQTPPAAPTITSTI